MWIQNNNNNKLENKVTFEKDSLGIMKYYLENDYFLWKALCNQNTDSYIHLF